MWGGGLNNYDHNQLNEQGVKLSLNGEGVVKVWCGCESSECYTFLFVLAKLREDVVKAYGKGHRSLTFYLEKQAGSSSMTTQSGPSGAMTSVQGYQVPAVQGYQPSVPPAVQVYQPPALPVVQKHQALVGFEYSHYTRELSLFKVTMLTCVAGNLHMLITF
jgi:hypothetical protein